MTTLSLYEFLPQNERWLQGRRGVQACLVLSAILLRRVPAAQAGLFFLAAGIVYFAERINDLAARHWQSFATQDYFDAHGIFYSAVVSAPLLATMFVILVRQGAESPGACRAALGLPSGYISGVIRACDCWKCASLVSSSASTPAHSLSSCQINYLVSTSSLLVQMKKKELLYKARQKQKKESKKDK